MFKLWTLNINYKNIPIFYEYDLKNFALKLASA
jgi:hypothetical protein